MQAEAEARIAEHAARASLAEEKAAAAAARAAELESRLAAADLAAVDAKEQLAEHLSWSSARLDQLQEHLSPGGSVAPRPPPWSGASYDDDAAPAAGTPGSSKSKTFGSLDGKSPRRRWHEPANGGGGEQASLARLRAEKRDLARAPPVVCGVCGSVVVDVWRALPAATSPPPPPLSAAAPSRAQESQLALLSEKMYGAAARSAATQRDQLQDDLDAERAERQSLEARVQTAEAAAAELAATKNELARTKMALRSSQTTHAQSLYAPSVAATPARDPIRAPSRAPPPRPSTASALYESRVRQQAAARRAAAATPGTAPPRRTQGPFAPR